MGVRSETHTCRECATRGDDGTNQRFDCLETRGLWTYARSISPLGAHYPNVYKQLMAEVIEVQALGSGVIGGAACDHLAFRTTEVDWQMWIAHGARPYPCRYVITAKQVEQGPPYSIQLRDWQSGAEVAAGPFSFTNT